MRVMGERTDSSAQEREQERGVARHLRRDLELQSADYCARVSAACPYIVSHLGAGGGRTKAENDHVCADDDCLSARVRFLTWVVFAARGAPGRGAGLQVRAEELRDAAGDHEGAHHQVDDATRARGCCQRRCFVPADRLRQLARLARRKWRWERLTRCLRNPLCRLVNGRAAGGR